MEEFHVKTVLAFLNSEIFKFVYLKKFNDIKILRGNLEQLPFPKISKEENNKIADMVDRVLNGEEQYKEQINEEIYTIFGINNEEKNIIQEQIYGTFK